MRIRKYKPTTAMAEWSNQDLPHSYFTGKNSTDNIKRDPNTGIVYPDPIPHATDIIQTAKKNVETLLAARHAGLILSRGRSSDFMDAALLLETEPNLFPLRDDVLDLLAWAYIEAWMAQAFTDPDDRMALQMRRAQTFLQQSVTAFANVASSLLNGRPGSGVRPRTRSRVVGVSPFGGTGYGPGYEGW